MEKIDTHSLWEWEKLLEDEWLWDIDKKEWFREQKISTQKSVNNILDIWDIEREKNIKIHVLKEDSTIEIYGLDGRLIGYIKPWLYTYHSISKSDHLEKIVFEEYRWKWFGQLLFDLYKRYNFHVPSSEYTHKISVIEFLLKNWYDISSIIADNWEEIELSENDIYEFFDEIKIRKQKKEDDLNFTYKMVRK